MKKLVHLRIDSGDKIHTSRLGPMGYANIIEVGSRGSQLYIRGRPYSSNASWIAGCMREHSDKSPENVNSYP